MKKFKFETFGVMIDMSRNAVMSLDGLKRYFPLLKKMGYNCVFLYTEDTYEVDGEPYFGYMRGRYAKDEMRAIDALGKEYGIEVIPCIQTLAHLATVDRWKKYPMDDIGILMVDDERTYELIDNMFKTLNECFTTKKIHVGMDEAHTLGRGKHLDQYGYETVDVLMKRHLDKVCKIADKYGYEIMIWSDMYFRPWNDGKYPIERREVPQEYIDALPESVIPVYWDYYQVDEQPYVDMILNHQDLSDKCWFAGGVWTWAGLVPQNIQSLKRMIPAIEACKHSGMKNVFFTMWGDNGAECSRFAILPSLFFISEYAKGNTDEEKIKAKFKSLMGISYDEFMLLDAPNYLSDDFSPNWQEVTIEKINNPTKYMFFSDPFNGCFDHTVKDGASAKCEEYAAQLRAVAKKSRKYGYLFDTEAKLADFMKYKYELGVKTRRAYQNGDKEELRRLANEDYTKAIKALGAFYTAFEHQWMMENKMNGFDVQDLRIGGLIKRLEACKKYLLNYVNGKLDRIEDLEYEILPHGGRDQGLSIYYNNHRLTISANVI